MSPAPSSCTTAPAPAVPSRHATASLTLTRWSFVRPLWAELLSSSSLPLANHQSVQRVNVTCAHDCPPLLRSPLPRLLDEREA